MNHHDQLAEYASSSGSSVEFESPKAFLSNEHLTKFKETLDWSLGYPKAMDLVRSIFHVTVEQVYGI